MISLVLCCVTLILILFIPESPSWLVSRGYVDEARLALSKIRGINQKSIENNFSIKVCILRKFDIL